VSLTDVDVRLGIIKEKYVPEQVKAARDCQHWSPMIHQDIADQMIQQYKEMANNAG
jgi:hypothetical protein